MFRLRTAAPLGRWRRREIHDLREQTINSRKGLQNHSIRGFFFALRLELDSYSIG